MACIAVPNFESSFNPYKSAKLEGRDIKIEAEDHSFEITLDKFEPPF